MGGRGRAAHARGDRRRGVVGGARRLGDARPGRGGASRAGARLTAPRAGRARRPGGLAARGGTARRRASGRAETRRRAGAARRPAAAALPVRPGRRSGTVAARRRAAGARRRVDHGGRARAPAPRRRLLRGRRCLDRSRPACGRGRPRLAGRGGRGRGNALAALVADLPSRHRRPDERRCAGVRRHRRGGRIAGALAGDARPAGVRARAVAERWTGSPRSSRSQRGATARRCSRSARASRRCGACKPWTCSTVAPGARPARLRGSPSPPASPPGSTCAFEAC